MAKCEVLWQADYDPMLQEDCGGFACSHCDEFLPGELQGEWQRYHDGYRDRPFDACPMCGASVAN